MSSSESQYEFLVTGYLRTAALSLAVYEYSSTLPLVWRIYRDHWTNRRPTIPVFLLFLLRLTSMLAILFAAFVFFHQGFTLQSCARFYLLPPIFRAMQTSVSQAILGHRAISLSRRSPYVTCTMIAAFAIACPLQWITTLFGRQPAIGTYWTNCRAAVISPFLGVWMSYAIAIAYDLLASGICLRYLWRLKGEHPLMSNFFKIMMCHGLGYLFVLTGTNILNTILFTQNSEFESAGAPLGCCVTMIMSQKLLTHVYNCHYGYVHGCRGETAVFSHDVLETTQFGRSLETQPSIGSQSDVPNVAMTVIGPEKV